MINKLYRYFFPKYEDIPVYIPSIKYAIFEVLANGTIYRLERIINDNLYFSQYHKDFMYSRTNTNTNTIADIIKDIIENGFTFNGIHYSPNFVVYVSHVDTVVEREHNRNELLEVLERNAKLRKWWRKP